MRPRRHSRLRLAALALAAIALAATQVSAPPTAQAAAQSANTHTSTHSTAAPTSAPASTTSVAVNGTSAGQTFDGIGAISGGGGNSALLPSYPPAQRTAILDYLFKPGYGADLQILKVEIGGDTNSTDGAESSIEHTRGTVDCNTGYEWWLMEQAKALNPNIKLYGLSWGAPGWIGGGNFWSTDMINYLVSWLGCAKSHGLTINYLGGWNERGYNIGWYEQLRSTLNADGYSGVTIVGADSDWSIANDIDTNPTFASAVGIIGEHYPCGYTSASDSCTVPAAATNSGKPLWASENGSEDTDSGAAPLIRSITRGYIDGGLTAYINWPLVASIYPNLGYDTTGLMLANSPWSGAYEVGAETWATAQVTQFSQPGWQFLNSGSGYLGGSESNGSYITLKSPNGSDYSTVLETTTATAAQTATFKVSGGLSTGTVHVWSTNLNSQNPADYFVHSQDITPTNGTYSLTMQPGYVYTVTTTTGQGKGAAQPTARASLPLPYSDSLGQATEGQDAKYLSDMNGAFQEEPCEGGRSGLCLRQMAETTPIRWTGESSDQPYTIGGDLSWSNYTVSAQVLLEQSSSAAEILGRVGTQAKNNNGLDAYHLRLSDTGSWQILKSDDNWNWTTLASGTVAAPGTGTWHAMALTFNGQTISASIDGTTVGSVTDSSYSGGQVGLGTDGYYPVEYSNLQVTPVGTEPVAATYQILNQNSGMALATSGGSTSQGAGTVQIAQATSTAQPGATDQQWQLTGTGTGYDTLTNVASGLVLDVPKSSTTEGVQLDQWSANGGANQQWRVTANADGTYTLASKSSGQAVDVQAGSRTAGADVVQWPANGAASQKWLLVPVPEANAAYGLVNRNSGMYADISGADTLDGGQLIQWVPDGGLNQRWSFTPLGGGDFTVTNINSGLVLDVPNISTTEGVQLDQWSANSGTNQQWQVAALPGGYVTLTARNSNMLAAVSGGSTQENASVVQWPADGGTEQDWRLVLEY